MTAPRPVLWSRGTVVDELRIEPAVLEPKQTILMAGFCTQEVEMTTYGTVAALANLGFGPKLHDIFVHWLMWLCCRLLNAL